MLCCGAAKPNALKARKRMHGMSVIKNLSCLSRRRLEPDGWLVQQYRGSGLSIVGRFEAEAEGRTRLTIGGSSLSCGLS
jgi:hypothetical protein